ncbi:extracellular solute-binding protein [Dactylosporangium siamense]|uniref:ABC transporter substrate-binding protein n=1 Tax=Dactylosporangium siamense TaxID=685454 RepID=A0A919PTX6_9ACTN|nr:extracellular solute-binding protein [Dactylosporangium siamense]GIG50134.1 ABC transporter substrate-binding protein [Dactylosporangium siamense]
MPRKRARGLLAALVATTTVLAGCSAGGDAGLGTADKPVTITLWEGFADGETTALRDMIAKYWTPTHPNIKVEVVGDKNAQAMLTAMSGGDAPDVVMSTDSESPALWFHNNAILDLSDLAAEIKGDLDAKAVPAARAWGEQNGKVFALPFVDYDWGVFYNKELFKQAGLDPDKPPATITELEAAARKLTKVDAGGNITQLGWLPLHDEWSAINLGMAFGATFVDGNKPAISQPAVRDAITWDANLARSYDLKKVAAFTSGFTKGDNPFALGKVAMYIDGCWQATMLKDSKIDFGVMSIPASDPAHAGATDVGTNPIVIPRAAHNQKAAKEFAKFMTLNADLAGDFSNKISNLPHLTGPLTTFTTDGPTKFLATLSTSKNARAWAPVPYARMYADQLAAVVDQVYNGGADVGQALDKAQQTLTDQAKQFQ